MSISGASRAAGSGVAVPLVATLISIYIVSQFLRNSIGVIAPNLAAELVLSPAENRASVQRVLLGLRRRADSVGHGARPLRSPALPDGRGGDHGGRHGRVRPRGEPRRSDLRPRPARDGHCRLAGGVACHLCPALSA